MTFKQHFTITTVLTLFLVFFYKNYLCALLFWLGGIFIDIDHYCDYIRATGDLRISFRKTEDFFLELNNLKGTKLIYFLHSYELIAFLFFLNCFFLKKDYLYGLIAGLTVHIVLDVMFNPVKIQSYFFIYRLRHSFIADKILNIKFH